MYYKWKEDNILCTENGTSQKQIVSHPHRVKPRKL